MLIRVLPRLKNIQILEVCITGEINSDEVSNLLKKASTYRNKPIKYLTIDLPKADVVFKNLLEPYKIESA